VGQRFAKDLGLGGGGHSCGGHGGKGNKKTAAILPPPYRRRRFRRGFVKGGFVLKSRVCGWPRALVETK
ncbi:MAG: hypothetical protein Q7J02_08910, partial [Rhodocyclaceae bacterium]|nr:hypothetical protein [Rhodocyclaceae bacterium]